MASQITHIPYGKKVLDLFLKAEGVDEQKFFVGTLFPDIRYLGVIERQKSHYQDPTVEGLMKIKGDFAKGQYAHALVDIERERVLTRLGVYDLLGNSPYITYAMKFIEDEFTYDLIPNWSKYIKYLDSVLPEEESLVPTRSAKKWHTMIQQYFSQIPTETTVIVFSKELSGFDPKNIPPTMEEMKKIRSNNLAMKIIESTYSELFK